jgi:hypothetical protein
VLERRGGYFDAPERIAAYLGEPAAARSALDRRRTTSTEAARHAALEASGDSFVASILRAAEHRRAAFVNAVDAFADWDGSGPEPTVEFEGCEPPQRVTLSQACRLMWKCRDPMPGTMVDELRKIRLKVVPMLLAPARCIDTSPNAWAHRCSRDLVSVGILAHPPQQEAAPAPAERTAWIGGHGTEP